MNTYSPEGSLLKNPKNIEYTSSVQGLTKAYEKQIILEGTAIMCDHDFNLHISLPCNIPAIIPKSEAIYPMSGEDIKDIAILTRVGKPVCFKVVGFRKRCGESCVVLSRRLAQEECYGKYISSLVPGDIVNAQITHLESFGAFADIGCGIISLLSIDSISVSRISHPKERLRVGERICAVIKSRDQLSRINISMRELLGTWTENAALFSEGETVGGIVRGIESYGIFVELTPNLAGLAEYKENVRRGQTAAVYIKSIIPDKMKVKLIIIDTQDGDEERLPFNYFVDTSSVTRISSWKYSPKNCKKLVESVF